MKREVKFFVISCILMLISFNAFSETAVVSFVRGKAEVCRNDAWVQLKTGDVIYPSETVSTGFQSELKIKYNNSIMALGALTRITLDELKGSSEKESVALYLNTGAVRSRVTHQDNKKVNYTVKSPVAVASVRGTDFLMTGSGTVSCMEGAVAVYVNTENKRDGMGRTTEREAEEEESSSTEPSSDSSSSSAVAAASSESSSDSSEYVPATATTPAAEISSSAPAGAVVVAQNQQVTVLKTGMIEKPSDNVEKKKAKIINTASSAVTTEAVSLGSVNTAGVQTAASEVTQAVSPTELNITVKLSD